MSVVRKLSPKGIIKKTPTLEVEEEPGIVSEKDQELRSPEKNTKSSVDTSERESVIRPKRVCSFCTSKTVPHYFDINTLRKSVSDRGRILNRTRTGACAKHQRRITTEIKRARHLSLFPFTVRV